jgi:universal stress protein E
MEEAMTLPIRCIVAGIADLDGQDPILPAAIALANRTGATLHLVHGFEMPPVVWSAYIMVGYADADILRHNEEGLRTRLEAVARSISLSDRIHCHAIAGPIASGIHDLAMSEAADLILVGATRSGRFTRTVLGTTAQRVMRTAPAPVLVLREPLPTQLRRVLLATDLSSLSAGIYEAGLDTLEALFADDEPEIRVVHAIWYPMDFPPSLTSALVEDTARNELDGFLRERRRRSHSPTGIVRVGDPAHHIVDECRAWPADILVVGTHSRSGVKRWVMGSVAEATVRNAEISVLVIPGAFQEQRRLPVVREHSTEVAAPTSG